MNYSKNTGTHHHFKSHWHDKQWWAPGYWWRSITAPRLCLRDRTIYGLTCFELKTTPSYTITWAYFIFHYTHWSYCSLALRHQYYVIVLVGGMWSQLIDCTSNSVIIPPQKYIISNVFVITNVVLLYFHLYFNHFKISRKHFAWHLFTSRTIPRCYCLKLYFISKWCRLSVGKPRISLSLQDGFITLLLWNKFHRFFPLYCNQ